MQFVMFCCLFLCVFFSRNEVKPFAIQSLSHTSTRRKNLCANCKAVLNEHESVYSLTPFQPALHYVLYCAMKMRYEYKLHVWVVTENGLVY